MEKLILCGKFRSESPEEDFCNSQSALNFITCANNRTDNDESSGRSKNKNIKTNKEQLPPKNGCQLQHEYADVDVKVSQERNKSLEMGKTECSQTQSIPLSKSGKFPSLENPSTKAKVKHEDVTCWAGIFDDDIDDDDDDCNNNKENNYVHFDEIDNNISSCISKRKRKVTIDENSQDEVRANETSKEISAELGNERMCYLTDLTDRFAVVRKIGSGTFGSVFLAVRLRDQVKVALKKLPKDRTKLEDFCLEFRYGRQFSRHPCVLETASVAYVTKFWYVLVQEYAPMSDLLRSVPPRVGLPEVAVKSVVRQIAGAVAYIHSKQVVHRDLKLENILVVQV